jgi:serine/threonine protein kinase, bacterial
VVFGPYELLEVLGRGGMGEVWRAHDTRRGRTVALKRLASAWTEQPDFRARFRREARTTAALNSPHVIAIHDYGEIDGQLYIDMPLITGGDLADLVGDHPDGLGADRAVALTDQIAAALHTAHQAGLIHRDVKPSNVLLDPGTRDDHAYLVDFGIVKIADDTDTRTLTVTGKVPGTPAYMAPELLTDNPEASPASDIYALGCVLFEMLTGHRPYSGASRSAVIGQHLYEPIPHPSDGDPTLAAYDAVITRALAKTPDQRYPDTRTLIQALHHAHTTPPRAPREAPSRPWWRRRRLVAVLAVVVLVLVVGIAVAARSATSTSASLPPGLAPTTPLTAGDPVRVTSGLGASTGLALSPDGRRAFVVDQDHGDLAVIDTGSGKVAATVPVGAGANSVALTPDGRRAYVTDNGESDDQPANSVSVVDTTTNTVTTRVPVGVRPLGIVASPDGRRMYVTNLGTDATVGSTVSAIDTGTNQVVATIPTGPKPAYPAVSADGTQLFVPNYGARTQGGNTVTMIDTRTDEPVATVAAGGVGPIAVTTAAGDPRVVVLLTGSAGSRGDVALLDPASGISDGFSVKSLVDVPADAAWDPASATLAVGNAGQDNTPDDTISILDTTDRSVRTTLELIGRPTTLRFGPGARDLWITTRRPGGLWHVSFS